MKLTKKEAELLDLVSSYAVDHIISFTNYLNKKGEWVGYDCGVEIFELRTANSLAKKGLVELLPNELNQVKAYLPFYTPFKVSQIY